MHLLTLLLRGLTLRCPNCGQRHIFRRWFTMLPRCPRCGLYFERVEGYWTGAIAINTIATEMVFLAMLVTVVVWTWPDIPMVPLLVAAIAVNAILPLVFYPFSKTIWVAIDLAAHPLEPREQQEVDRLQVIKERSTPH